MSTQLLANQNVVETINGTDAGGNVAPVTITSFTVDNHAVVYAVGHGDDSRIPAGAIEVVSRGPIGTATLTVEAQSAMGVALPAQAKAFVVVTGDATGFTLSDGTIGNNGGGTPAMPAGW